MSSNSSGAFAPVSKAISMLRIVLEERPGLGAPKQVEYLAGYLEAERPGRKASKRAAPLRRCAPPAPKTFGGHDTADRSWGGADSQSDLFGPPICPHSPIGKATVMAVTYDSTTISCHLYGDIKSYVIIYLRKQWAT